MKKKEIRKYLRRADDYMEKIEKKMRYIDSTLFFLSLGLEYFCQQEDCQQSNMVQLIKDYLQYSKLLFIQAGGVKDSFVSGVVNTKEIVS